METMNVYVAWLGNDSAFQAFDLLLLSLDIEGWDDTAHYEHCLRNSKLGPSKWKDTVINLFAK